MNSFWRRAAKAETLPGNAEPEISITDALHLAVIILKQGPDFETNLVCTKDNPVRPLRAHELLPVLERVVSKIQEPG
jgi:hypothetical protein